MAYKTTLHLLFLILLKQSLLLVLLLPLSCFAQTGRNMMQINQQSRQDFNRMVNQRNQDFQSRQMLRSRSGSGSGLMTAEQLAQAQAKQQQLEQAATDKLTQLARQQQQRREQYPAANPQQAALQQKKDEKQLNILTVKNYREVFLPGQVVNALQAQQLPARAQQNLRNLNESLTDKLWWKKQEGAGLTAKLTAYSDTLSSLTTSLLGFDLASPPAMPPPFSLTGLTAQLATHTFDQTAATQLVRDAALSDKLVAGEQLAKAVNNFRSLSTAAVQSSPTNSKKLKEDVQASLRTVNKEMERYYARISAAHALTDAQKALLKSTSDYLAKNRK
ncbi:hypothetical protein [Hymenobacter sp. APR13]|uniref:hypothetical protein n=1 Tax=Hymenobacter sp. APR13 TaxID=1356852 RepID=UPI0004E0AC7D|nr:hypothetical protein [Hymenobacter sp. APR13]AII50894.1 hypothetical protein N008_02720 [Hymenobacter sp. APR13]